MGKRGTGIGMTSLLGTYPSVMGYNLQAALEADGVIHIFILALNLRRANTPASSHSSRGIHRFNVRKVE